VLDQLATLFPDLILVTDEAVNCRNYYVHGSRKTCDYDGSLGIVAFLTNTLEFVFAASDFIDAGWNAQSWAQRGTTMSHPFSGYRRGYLDNLRELKSAITASSEDDQSV
jgi:hypothetical protein